MNLLDFSQFISSESRGKIKFKKTKIKPKKLWSILGTPPHNGEEKKAALLKMSGIKIHSNVHFFFVFHEQSKKGGSAEHLYCTIQNSVNNTAGTHGYVTLKTVLSGWFSYWVNTWARATETLGFHQPFAIRHNEILWHCEGPDATGRIIIQVGATLYKHFITWSSERIRTKMTPKHKPHDFSHC